MSGDLERNLRFGFLIHDVSRMRRIVIDRALKPLRVTRSQWWVLAFLSRRDGMTQTALAVDLDLTKVAVGGLVDRLEVAGYVERRLDTLDARSRRVFLTKAGVKLVNKIRVHVDTVEKEILMGLENDQIDAVAKALIQIKTTLLDLIGAEGPDSAQRGVASALSRPARSPP